MVSHELLRMAFDDGLLFVGVMTVIGCTTKVILTKMQRRRDLPDTLGRSLDQIAMRLERLEQSAETTALEVERISEGQRFTTKLLAERGQSAQGGPLDANRGAGRANTPH